MQAIDAVALIQRLEQFVLGDDADAMTDAQVNAALWPRTVTNATPLVEG
jgi:hypothetical protein